MKMGFNARELTTEGRGDTKQGREKIEMKKKNCPKIGDLKPSEKLK